MDDLVTEIATATNSFISYNKRFMPSLYDGKSTTATEIHLPADTPLVYDRDCGLSGQWSTIYSHIPSYAGNNGQHAFQAGESLTVQWHNCRLSTSEIRRGQTQMTILEGMYGGDVRTDDAKWREDVNAYSVYNDTNNEWQYYTDGDITADVNEKEVILTGTQYTQHDFFYPLNSNIRHYYRLNNFQIVMTNTSESPRWNVRDLVINGSTSLTGTTLESTVNVTYSDISTRGFSLGYPLSMNGTVTVQAGDTNAEIQFIDGAYTWRLDTDNDGTWDWQDSGALD
jgi:hypothetical protein